MVPGFKLKNLQQLGRHASFATAATATWRQGGVLAFYDTFWSQGLRDIPYTMLELGMYETVLWGWQQLRKVVAGAGLEAGAGPELSTAERWACSAVSGGVTGALTNPFDLVLTRTTTSGVGGGVLETFRTVMREGGGWRALFVGANARVWWRPPRAVTPLSPPSPCVFSMENHE
jgi:solute carrier family 25 S-adenosylmethionine transporter 26